MTNSTSAPSRVCRCCDPSYRFRNLSCAATCMNWLLFIPLVLLFAWLCYYIFTNDTKYFRWIIFLPSAAGALLAFAGVSYLRKLSSYKALNEEFAMSDRERAKKLESINAKQLIMMHQRRSLYNNSSLQLPSNSPSLSTSSSTAIKNEKKLSVGISRASSSSTSSTDLSSSSSSPSVIETHTDGVTIADREDILTESIAQIHEVVVDLQSAHAAATATSIEEQQQQEEPNSSSYFDHHVTITIPAAHHV